RKQSGKWGVRVFSGRAVQPRAPPPAHSRPTSGLPAPRGSAAPLRDRGQFPSSSLWVQSPSKSFIKMRP
ncbi:hypothetical protein U0070_016030, partial [Myodes glareolus]